MTNLHQFVIDAIYLVSSNLIDPQLEQIVIFGSSTNSYKLNGCGSIGFLRERQEGLLRDDSDTKLTFIISNPSFCRLRTNMLIRRSHSFHISETSVCIFMKQADMDI